jgi:hypothetical protein
MIINLYKNNQNKYQNKIKKFVFIHWKRVNILLIEDMINNSLNKKVKR